MMAYPQPKLADQTLFASGIFDSSTDKHTGGTKRRSTSPIASLSLPNTSYDYDCTLCWQTFKAPSYSVGAESRIVCLNCWRWIYNTSICWKCVEVIYRKTDAVSFGWCWWHWACFSCLICATPLHPPPYFNTHDQPHKYGMMVDAPPLCDQCSNSPDSLPRLEQHAHVLRLPKHGVVPPARIVDGAGSHVSLTHPFSPEANLTTSDPLKQISPSRRLPPWMKLLPSNVNSHINPPTHSVLQHRTTFPYFESTRYSTPFVTPFEFPPTSHEEYNPLRSVSQLKLPHHDKKTQKSSSPTYSSASKDAAHASYLKQALLAHIAQSRRLSHAGTSHSSSRLQQLMSKARFKAQDSFEHTSNPQSLHQHPKRRRWVHNAIVTDLDARCSEPIHTAKPPQDVSPAKLPFFKELSSFLVARAGKLVLPSRVGESINHRHRQDQEPLMQSQHVRGDSCEVCGADTAGWWRDETLGGHHSEDAPVTGLGWKQVCRSCKDEAVIPGAWL